MKHLVLALLLVGALAASALFLIGHNTQAGSGATVNSPADVTIVEQRTVPLVAGWNDVCHTGPAGPAGDVLAPLGSAVVIVYRLTPTQGFDRWIPGRPDISTMTTVSAYDQLIILMTSGTVWEQQVAVPPASVMLVQGWNSICYAGSDNDPDAATAGIAGKFVAVYRLSTGGGLDRYFPARPDISTLGSLQTYDSIFVIATQDAEWVFDVPPGPTPTPVPAGESCAPVFPGTYNGTVTVGGAPAPDGTIVRAATQGITWASAVTSGGRYVFEVPQLLPAVPPCFYGGTLTFACEGAVVAEETTWNAGLHDLNLTCGAGVCGDVNCGQNVDAVDCLFILQHVVGTRSCSDVCPAPANTLYCPLADTLPNGSIDAVDALFCLQHVVGIPPAQWCAE